MCSWNALLYLFFFNVSFKNTHTLQNVWFGNLFHLAFHHALLGSCVLFSHIRSVCGCVGWRTKKAVRLDVFFCGCCRCCNWALCTVIIRLSTSTHSWGQSPVTPQRAMAWTKDVKGQSWGIKCIKKPKTKQKKSDRGEDRRINGEQPADCCQVATFKALEKLLFPGSARCALFLVRQCEWIQRFASKTAVTFQTVKQADSLKNKKRRRKTLKNWSTYSWHPNKLDEP